MHVSFFLFLLHPPTQGNMFGSSFNLAAAGLGDLPSDILVPGVAVFSRRALPLAAWTNGLEISGTRGCYSQLMFGGGC
jgi:hypothetical protein